jgi:hypothetical protein
MKRILVIEDGNEYEEFARLFLGDRCEISAAHSAAEALLWLEKNAASGFIVDLRFDRAPDELLIGDVGKTAARLFAGDHAAATSYLKDNQGVLILGEIRRAGHDQPAVLVQALPERRLENLKRLYGNVATVPSFDAAAIGRALGWEK